MSHRKSAEALQNLKKDVEAALCGTARWQELAQDMRNECSSSTGKDSNPRVAWEVS